MGALKRGAKRRYTPCRDCGAPITLTQWWKGWHEGCTRPRRNYPLHKARNKPRAAPMPERLRACEAELERFWIEEGWGVRPPSIVD